MKDRIRMNECRATRVVVRLAVWTGISLTVIASPAFGQTEPKSVETAARSAGAQQWRAFFNDARLAYEQGKYVEAKSLYLKAIAIRSTPKILSNLAQVELALGEYRAAATDATEALASLSTSKSTESNLATALKHVGKWTVTVNVEGATATVDGEETKITGTSKVIFVDPGMRKITLSKAGYVTTEREVAADQGGEQTLRFELNAEPSAPLPLVATAPPAATKTPSAKEQPKPFEVPKSHPNGPNAIVLFAGGAIAVGAVVTGFVFNAKSNHAEERMRELRERTGRSGCYDGGARIASTCSELLDEGKRKDRSQNISTGAFVVGGAAVLGTALYWLWPRGWLSAGQAKVQVTSAASKDNATLLVSGRF